LSELHEKTCKPCEGGVNPLSHQRISQYLEHVPGWQASADGKSINKKFEFKGFFRTMSFINALAWIANQQGHHPDFSAGYSYCDVLFTTHAVNGLTENDFICASRVNALLES
jgi:4a-hydroxytetrahydrobiopterin dehydratase